MILIYILLCFLIGYTYKKTNLLFSFILGIFSLSLLLNKLSIGSVIEQTFSNITDILNNQFYILFFILIILLFVIFDLFSLYNYNYPLEEMLESKKIGSKKIILTLVSFFSTNIDFTNSRLDIDGKTNFKLNSILLPMLNVSSIPFIYIFMLFSFLLIKSISDGFIIVGMLLNVFVIFWFIFNILILFTKHSFHFDINNSIYNDIIPNITVKEMDKRPLKIEKKNLKFFFIGFIISSLVTFIFIIDFSFVLLIDIFLFFVLFFFIYQGEILAYKHSFIKEKDIYSTIYNSSSAFLYEIIEIILSVLLAINIYNLLNALNINLTITTTFFAIIILMMILFIMFNNYKFVATTTIPILAIYINSMTHVKDNMFLVIFLISSYITLLGLFQFLSIISANKLSRIQLNIVLVLIIISLLYILLIFLDNPLLYILYALILIISITLAFILSQRSKK